MPHLKHKTSLALEPKVVHPSCSDQGRIHPQNKNSRAAYFRALGKRIGELRRAREFTQADIARMLGVSQQTVFSYELGDRKWPVDRLASTAKMLGVSIAQLIGQQPLSEGHKARITPKLARHIEALKRLRATDQRFIIRLAEIAAQRPKI